MQKNISIFERGSPTIETRFWRKVERKGEDDCWQWVGATRGKGYGGMMVRKGITDYAHRISWELHYDNIPAEMVVDHQCHNLDKGCLGGSNCTHRKCVNPKHLSLKTHKDNLSSGRSGGTPKGVPRGNLKTHCNRGHEFTKENTLGKPEGYRQCRTCHNKVKREWMREKRAKIKSNAEYTALDVAREYFDVDLDK